MFSVCHCVCFCNSILPVEVQIQVLCVCARDINACVCVNLGNISCSWRLLSSSRKLHSTWVLLRSNVTAEKEISRRTNTQREIRIVP